MKNLLPLPSLAVVAAALALPLCTAAARADPLLPGVKRVVFLGDSITYSGQYAAYVEAYFVTRQPGRNVEFVNVGLPSETASGLSEAGHAGGRFPRPDVKERLARVLQQTRPDLVIACYGMNDGIYQPFDAGRSEAFRQGMTRLHDAVVAANARIIHLTPPHYDGQKTGNPAYAGTLDRYAKWLLDQRGAAGWTVIDVYGPMTNVLNEKRKADPEFAYARDGVHPDDFGHWVIAQQVLRGLGAKDIESVPDARQMVAAFPGGERVLALVRRRMDLMKDAWLTATGHRRPDMRAGLPLEDARKKAAEMAAEIRGLQGKQ